ncbi:MAG: alpha/beta family hydrolase [Bacteroidota bacterium]
MKELTGHFEVNEEKGNVSYLSLIPPDAKAYLVLGHGAGAGMKHEHMESLAHALAAVGIGTFRYHFPYMERGGGGRDGKKVTLTTIKQAVKTGKAIAPELVLLAGGHSFGGRMTAQAAVDQLIPDVKALIYFSFPLHAPGKPGTERAAHLKTISLPQLFLSGTRDTFAKSDLLPVVTEGIGEKATLHWLEGADHSYKVLKRSGRTREAIYQEAGENAQSWLKGLADLEII